MGNLLGKDGPLVKLSCIHVADASDIHISCVDGVEKERGEGEKKIKKKIFPVLEKEKMAEKRKKVELKKKELEDLVSLRGKKKRKIKEDTE